MKVTNIFILLFSLITVALLIALVGLLLAPAATAVEVEVEPGELTEGKAGNLDLSVTSEHTEDIHVQIFRGRREYGGSLLFEDDLSVTSGQEWKVRFGMTPWIGQNELFIFLSGTQSGTSDHQQSIHGTEDYSDVLLILNNNSDISKEIGDYFLDHYDPHVLYVDAPAKEVITRAEFDTVRDQIENFLTGSGLEDDINYLLTTKGVPLKVSGTGNAGFDSELTLILGAYSGDIGGGSYRYNPYHNVTSRFSRSERDIYLVTRLTGYTVEDAKGMVDRSVAALTPEALDTLAKGVTILDVDPGRDNPSYRSGNDWMRASASLQAPKGYNVYLDKTTTFVRHQENVSFYASWGSNDGHDTVVHGTNTGMETDSGGDTIPDNWDFDEGNGAMERTGEDRRGGSWSVRIVRDQQTGESSLLQEFTPEVGYRYYVQGYANTTGVTGSGGIRLVVRQYNSGGALIHETLGAIRRGTTTDFTSLGSTHIEPIEGTDHVEFGFLFKDAEGTVYLDDARLIEVVPDNSYLDGSLAETIVSTGARSFNYPTSYGQSLIADIIRAGVTGVKGYCYEPYLDAIAHPNILFDRYTAGWNLAESYYAASIKLSWMDVVVGVPKLAPFSLLPDIAISSLQVIPDPLDSMNRTINMTVANWGGSLSSDWNITLVLSNGTQNWTTVLYGLPLFSGESISFTLNWTAPEAGDHTLDALLLSDPSAPFPGSFERSLFNNHVSGEFEVLSPPDLVVNDHSVFPTVPGENEPFQLTVTIRNQGDSPASGVNVTLLIDDIYHSSTVIDAGGLENAFATFSSLSLPSGEHTFLIRIDPNDTIRESDESNNEEEFFARINRLPEPLIMGSLFTQVGQDLVLNASLSYDLDGEVVQYIWLVKGKSRLGEELTTSFSSRGIYPIEITVVDNDWGESILVVNVTVMNTPPVAAFTTIPATLLTMESFSFDGRPSFDNDSTPLSYLWDFSDGTTADRAIKTKSYEVPGIYLISLVVEDDEGSTSIATHVITILNRAPVPALTISTDGTNTTVSDFDTINAQTHSAIEFDPSAAYDPDGAIDHITIDTGDGTLIVSVPPDPQSTVRTYTYTRAGLFPVTVTFTDNRSSNASLTFMINVENPQPIASFTYSSIDPISGEPSATDHTTFESILFSSTSSDNGKITSYRWEIEDILYTTPIANHTFERPGIFTISLTVTDDEGLSDTWSDWIEVTNLPPTVSNAQMITLAGESLFFRITATDRDGTIESYRLELPDGSTAVQTSPEFEITLPESGVYHLNVTVTDELGEETTTVLVITVYHSVEDPIVDASDIEIIGFFAGMTIIVSAFILIKSKATELKFFKKSAWRHK